MSREKLCRFYFERPLHDHAVLIRGMNPKYEMFDGARPNDGRLNNYARAIVLGWLANTDSVPTTSLRAVLTYISKYCSRAESQTQPYKDILRELIPRVNSRQPLVTLISKMLNKLLAERDWPAMEVAHLLLDLPLVECSHNVVPVDCRDPRLGPWAAFIPADRDKVMEGKSFYTKYCARTAEWRDLTYFDCLRNVNCGRRRWTRFGPNAKPRMLSYFPRYKSEPDEPAFEDFARVKLMLHHLHTTIYYKPLDLVGRLSAGAVAPSEEW
ncbi:hypothetical protein B0T26DRAFT_729060 [Lasiosphaeria miniovina]|uniref:Uncharacterized protein n=1 Tax=Lasiosphaeria miniovina TaxID=1954250 RepID=A0AA40A0I3_9PEZI|nr:uncharacterized protein B0T26DRAFT_729060 [Lasiosphaeria miniovina]KAK0707072.1 hypothetical protein B0T26DRAFT_729060 [Lasiosphaeria miniovina]